MDRRRGHSVSPAVCVLGPRRRIHRHTYLAKGAALPGMTSVEPFALRVQSLRETWLERRMVKALAGSHDRDSQFQLLGALHQWAVHAAADIQRVYGEALHVELSPPPEAGDPAPGFHVAVGRGYSVSFGLHERRRATGSSWFVDASVLDAGRGAVAAGPERRNGQWTRGRMEDLLLSVLGAYERALNGPEPLAG
ncbi:MAG: hypothetical protein U0547_01870 [Dehalococcoidia bacterium]